MGIQGLLPFLKPLAQRKNIKDFAGKTVGVDAMCWMHKGAFACSQELVLGQDTDKFVYYFLRMCEVLRFNGVKPVIVFDGERLPAKAKEESNRMEQREAARKEALELMERRRAGEHIDEHVLASKCETAIRVTSAMIARLMTALRELSIHFLVAPYEADAQLAYMCRIGWVHAVISEDSDLLAYGCPNTFFKMDKYGDGQSFSLPCLQPVPLGESDPAELIAPCSAAAEELLEEGKKNVQKRRGRGAKGSGRGRGKKGSAEGEAGEGSGQGQEAAAVEAAEEAPEGEASKESPSKAAAKDIDFSILASWTAGKFAEFCVLCGTDYKEPDVHIKGLGIKTAFRLLCDFRNAERMLHWMQGHKRWKEKLPCDGAEYLSRFQSIVAVFWHHNVFDPRLGECVSIARSFPHTDRQLPGIDLSLLCGTPAAKGDAARIAMGEIDARTRAERKHEPLTPAERRTMDRIIEQKRADQREFQFHLSLREDAKRIADEQAAAAEAASQRRGALGVASATASVAAAQPAVPPDNGEAAAMDLDDEEPPARPMCLLSGDIQAIMAVKDEALGGEFVDTPEKTPPRLASTALGPLSTATTTPAHPANPFVRKRSNGPTAGSSAVLEKRQRVLRADAIAALVAKQRAATKQAAADALSHVDDFHGAEEARRLVAPENRPRGGWAAKDAAAAVLAQRGIVSVERIDEAKDRSKLTGFFRSRTPPTEKSKESKESGLAKWRARPWEIDEDPAPQNRGKNVLSLDSFDRRCPFKFMKA
mmetsp:Transcript_30148/g.65851  ORF Transcript_30148/g.65851 Transcript_30148/m.65851 type:complete len:762 (+) Transcript_30148:202-2487(+)